MTDYTLKFADEAEATAVLFTDGIPNYQNIDIIGTIYKQTGIDADEKPIMTSLAGWHVNVRCDEAPELDAYAVFPATPMRVWA